MPVNQVSSSDKPLYERDTSNDPSIKVSTETFLKLLVAQLKYQDPLEPQKDTAFVTQMAQMTSLQEMQQMNATLQNSQAYDMVGMEIYAEVFNKQTGETKQVAGVVDSVAIVKGIPYVVVGTQAINIADVKRVFPPPVIDDTPAEDDTQAEEEIIVEDDMPAENDTPSDTTAPAENDTPRDTTAPAEDETPSDTTAPNP